MPTVRVNRLHGLAQTSEGRDTIQRSALDIQYDLEMAGPYELSDHPVQGVRDPWFPVSMHIDNRHAAVHAQVDQSLGGKVRHVHYRRPFGIMLIPRLSVSLPLACRHRTNH